GHPFWQNLQPRHASWSTRTIPSSSRLYKAPVGQEATQDGLRQCSQMRGKYIIKVRSYSILICSCIFSTLGSLATFSLPPAKSSSQLDPHSGLSIYFPVIVETGRATGKLSLFGLWMRLS